MEEESWLGPPHLGDNDWHDTAVEIRGPATRVIEDQFARNWDSAELKGPTPTIDYPQDQQVQIALTQPPPALPPIPRPTEEINGWLHRVTFLHFALMGCREFRYQDSSGLHRVLHRPADSWEFHYERDWYEKSFLKWDNGSTSIKNVREGVGITPFYTLTALEGRAFKRIQIHSKACLFDDEEADIGSANFNPRSLRLDGEMTVFFRGSSAQSFRSQLWSEYFTGPGLTTPGQASQWPAAAAASLRALHAHGQPRTLYAIPLQLNDFPVTHEPDLDPQETLIMKASLY